MPSHRYRGAVTDRVLPTYSVTANCSHFPGAAAATTSAAASDMGHSMTQPAAAMAAPFIKRIRVTSKPKADVSMVSQPTCVRSGQQAVATDGSEATATEQAASDSAVPSNQQARPQASMSDAALSFPAALAAADSRCAARDTDVQQMSHTPLYSFSQTFQHGIVLTHGNGRGSGSPVPQRAISEQPSTSNAHLTCADWPAAWNPSTSLTHEDSEACRGNADSAMSNTHRLADTAYQVREDSPSNGQCQAENSPVALLQPLSAQPQQLTAWSQQLDFQPQQLSTMSQPPSRSADQAGSNQQLPASGGSAGGLEGSSSRQFQGEDSECRAGRARDQQSSESDRQGGAAMMISEEDDWCEVPASPRWWDNVAKTDVIGMKELQRCVRHTVSYPVACSCLGTEDVVHSHYRTVEAAQLW